MLWSPDKKNQLTGKDRDAGKGSRQEEETIEDEMVGWHHQLSGHEFEQAQGDSEGQETWCAAVHEVPKSQRQMSDWTAEHYKGNQYCWY